MQSCQIDFQCQYQAFHQVPGNVHDPEVINKVDWICDTQKLKSHIEQQKSEIVFYCGASSHTEKMIPLFDALILLTAKESVIRQRLSTRTSNDFGKAKEIQDMVVEWQEGYEKMGKKYGAIVVDTNNELERVAAEVIEKISKHS